MTTAGSDPSADTLRAIGCMVLAILLFSSMNAMVKSLGDTYPVSQIIFARSVFALVVLAPMVAKVGGLASLKSRRPLGHLGRSLAGICAMSCGFTAITLLPLANAAALGFTAPLFTTVLGVLLLGEKVRWRRTVALVIGFTGVLLMLVPRFSPEASSGTLALDPIALDTLALGSLLALAGAALAALAMISIRRLSTTEPSTTIVFWFMATGTVASGLVLPFEYVQPTPIDALMFIAIGLIGGIAQVLLTQAYRGAPVAVVAPFDYTAMIWATVWGYLIWHELPDPIVLVGAAVVIGSGVYITLRELKLGVTQAPPAKIRGELP